MTSVYEGPPCLGWGLCSLALWLAVPTGSQGAFQRWQGDSGLRSSLSPPPWAPWASHLLFPGLRLPSYQHALWSGWTPRVPASSLSLSGGGRVGSLRHHSPQLRTLAPGQPSPWRTSRQAASPSGKAPAAPRLGRVPAGRSTRCPQRQPDPRRPGSLYISRAAERSRARQPPRSSMIHAPRLPPGGRLMSPPAAPSPFPPGRLS